MVVVNQTLGCMYIKRQRERVLLTMTDWLERLTHWVVWYTEK